MPYHSFGVCKRCAKRHGLKTVWDNETCRNCGADAVERVRRYTSSGEVPEQTTLTGDDGVDYRADAETARDLGLRSKA